MKRNSILKQNLMFHSSFEYVSIWRCRKIDKYLFYNSLHCYFFFIPNKMQFRIFKKEINCINLICFGSEWLESSTETRWGLTTWQLSPLSISKGYTKSKLILECRWVSKVKTRKQKNKYRKVSSTFLFDGVSFF